MTASWQSSNLNSVNNLGLSSALGKFTAVDDVHVIGHATGIKTTLTDFWDLADVTPTQQVWLAPTGARIHNLKSDAAADAFGGVGAKVVRVFGLQTWDSPATFEDVPMTGVTNAPTANSYVLVRHIQVVSYGASGPNAGTITATAESDLTISAVILPLLGLSRQAVYGVPSTHAIAINEVFVSLLRTGGGNVDVILQWNLQPDSTPNTFLQVGVIAVSATGTSHVPKRFNPPLVFNGPALLKLSGVGSIANLHASAGLDADVIRKDA